MRRIKSSGNLWLLLALPLIGALGWAIGRFMGRRDINPRDKSPILEQSPEMAAQMVEAVEPASNKHELSTGQALISPPGGASIFYILLVPFMVLATAVIFLALQHLPVQSQSIVPGGDPKSGQVALQSWGCGSCHTIPGVTGATGKVGPALSGLSDRSFIAGHLQNTPDNMIQWIMHPQKISPGVDMPDTGVPETVARDMAAYLYSIR